MTSRVLERIGNTKIDFTSPDGCRQRWELDDATVSQTLDYVLRTFTGFWVYENCVTKARGASFWACLRQQLLIRVATLPEQALPRSLLTFRIPVSIGSWDHPQYELIDGHDARDASYCQGFVGQLLKAQPL